MQRRTRALAISRETKRIVFERDGGRCVLCGAPGCPDAHYISRAQGGLGMEQNIVTLCRRCHMEYDQSTKRNAMKSVIADYLRGKYPDWNEIDLIYRKE